MRAVKSSGGKSTEWRLRAGLIQAGLRGWSLNPKNVPGRPDFIFQAYKLAVFVDGCFWHGCPKCYRRPSSSQRYWDSKVVRNSSRDKRIRAVLRRKGWKVLRFWEHELGQRRVGHCIQRVKKAIIASRLAMKIAKSNA